MKLSMAAVATEQASSYLRKLCQHWSHKFPVSFDDLHGTIDLAVGTCLLDAELSALKVRLELPSEENEADLQRVVEEHLRRFASRETLVFNWRPVSVPVTTASQNSSAQ